MVNPIQLPAPYAGIDDLSSPATLESPFCESLINFSASEEGVSLRHGDAEFTSFSKGNLSSLSLIAPYGDSKLFSVFQDTTASRTKVYDTEAGTLSYTSAGNSSVYGSSFFNGRLFLFTGVTDAPGYNFDGSSWAATGYTGSSLYPVAGVGFKHRHYLIQAVEPWYWYSEIDAISGAMTKVDLSTVINENSDLICIAPFTLAEGLGSQQILTFVFDSGLVLFYDGSYPNSSDWREVGRAKIGRPVGYNAYVQYQGDVHVICDSGFVSLRDLFLKGSAGALAFSVNSRIQDHWRYLMLIYAQTFPLSAANVARGVYDQKNNRIIVMFPGYRANGASYASGVTYFIFDTRRQSWSIHESSVSRTAIAYYKGKVITAALGASKAMFWEKEGYTYFVDANPEGGTTGIAFELISAPVSTGRSYVQKCEGLDVFIKSDLHSVINYSLIAELGSQTSSQQKVTGQASTLIKSHVNIGIEGSYIQYKISGTTSFDGETVGLHLYGVNFWQEQGSSPR